MSTKLQELTDKIYAEGIEKANTEAAEIISKAKKEAEKIKSDSQIQAEKKVQDAEAKAEELMKNTQAELKLFAQQSVNALKTEITNLISGEIVSDSIKAAATDQAFMQKMLLKLVEELADKQEVTIEAKDAKALEDYFMANAKSVLNKKINIKEANNVKADFTVIPAEGGYKLTFGEEEFIAYFKAFLRPKLVKMLF